MAQQALEIVQRRGSLRCYTVRCVRDLQEANKEHFLTLQQAKLIIDLAYTTLENSE
jgi:hypothetical protein